MSDSLSRIEAILASKQPGAAPYTGVPQSRLEEELLETDFSKPTKVVESFSEMTEEGQVYAIRNTEEGEYNSFTEYILVDGNPERIGKQDEIVDAYTRAETDSLLGAKVDKENGKALSTNDYTDTDKNKLDGIEEGAQVNPELAEVAYSGSYEDLKDIPSSSALVTVRYTIRAGNWSGNSYSLELDYPSTEWDIIGIYPINGITTDAMEAAWTAANCYGYSVTNVILARGTVPSIDIEMELAMLSK